MTQFKLTGFHQHAHHPPPGSVPCGGWLWSVGLSHGAIVFRVAAFIVEGAAAAVRRVSAQASVMAALAVCRMMFLREGGSREEGLRFLRLYGYW